MGTCRIHPLSARAARLSRVGFRPPACGESARGTRSRGSRATSTPCSPCARDAATPIRSCVFGAIRERPMGEVRWPSRERPVRPPARPLGVLDPRRGVQDPGAGAEGGRARDARRDAHGPRLDGRRRRPLQGRDRAGDQADLRLRGVRRRRPPRADQGARAPHAPRRRQPRLRQPRQALLARVPRGVLLQAARRLGAARAPCRRADRALRLPVGTCLAGAHRAPRGGRRGRARPARPDLRPRLDVRRAAERRHGGPAAGVPRASRPRRQARSSRSSPPATSTTWTRPTRRATTRSSASSRATR